MNLRERAGREGMSCAIARCWFTSGLLPVPARRVGGLILVSGSAAGGAGVTAVCARVLSAGREAGLGRQVARVTAWAASRGLPVGTVIVAGHHGGFARFGAGYAGTALESQGRRLPVAGPAGAGDDLVRDVTEILSALCAHIRGRRVAAGRAARAVAEVTRGAP